MIADEDDMVAALVSTLKTLFVSQGTQVLMTSHSPMTVAALDEADVFRIVRTGGHVEVSRTTKPEAINELSEGLATVDTGLRIAAYDEAKVTILTEGNNAKHLMRWVELNFPNDVRVFEDLGQHTNDGQLLAYGRLLGRMNTNTHFVVVWDCDAARKAESLRQDLPGSAKVTLYAFPGRPDNTIAPSNTTGRDMTNSGAPGDVAVPGSPEPPNSLLARPSGGSWDSQPNRRLRLGGPAQLGFGR